MISFYKSQTIVTAACALLFFAGCSAKTPSSYIRTTYDVKVTEQSADFLVRDPQWGDVNGSGLQMGIWRPVNSPTLFLTIRNKSPRNVRYNTYYLGDFEAASLWARPVGAKEWKELPRRQARRYYLSAGPIRRNDQILLPDQKILPFAKSKLPNPSLSKEFASQVSFYDALWDFEWPSSFSNDIAIYITQRSITYDSFTLRSGVIIVPKVAITAAPVTS